jgi:CxxC motif-containing protein
LTSTVTVENGMFNMVSVKTERDIPKNKIKRCVELLRGVKVKAPVKIGDVIIKNAADTGVDIIASKSIEAR